jgi:hypothetical protein
VYDIDAPFLGMIRVPRRRIFTKPLPNTFVQNRQNFGYSRVLGFRSADTRVSVCHPFRTCQTDPKRVI